MKENVLRIGRLFLFFILGACCWFVGCNSDDEDEIQIIEETFLEKYDGSKWVTTDAEEGWIYYLRVNNNLRFPYEFWGRPTDLEKANKEDGCYFHQEMSVNEVPGDGIEIMENSGNRFRVGDEMESWTLEIKGDVLTFTISRYGGRQDSIIFEKTNVNVDAFEICPDDYYEKRFLN